MNINFLGAIVVVFVSLLSIILHELSHGVVAYWLGDTTAKDAGRLTLNPLKHIDPYMSIIIPVIMYFLNIPVLGGAKPVPVNKNNLKGKEWGMALVALAGPLMNFLIALVSFLIGYRSGLLLGNGGEIAQLIFVELVYINLSLMIFNLIPIPPLDGSRVLYAISPDFFRNFLDKIESFGIIVIYLAILVFGAGFSGLMSSGINGILQFFYSLI